MKDRKKSKHDINVGDMVYYESSTLIGTVMKVSRHHDESKRFYTIMWYVKEGAAQYDDEYSHMSVRIWRDAAIMLENRYEFRRNS